MVIDRRLLRTAPDGITVVGDGFSPEAAIRLPRVLHHALVIAAVALAIFFTLQPSGWLRSTLYLAVLLAVFLAGAMRLRVAAVWPASLVLLVFTVACPIIGSIPENDEVWEWGYLHLPVSLLVVIFILELAALRASDRGLSRREIGLCGVLALLMASLVIFPALESWVATDNVESAIAVASLVIVARSVVLAGASVRATLGSRSLLGMALAVIAAAFTTQVAGIWIGARPPDRLARAPMVIAHHVREQLAYHYPRWQSDPETLDGTWTRYRAELAAASLGCNDDEEPCIEMLHVLRDLLAEFRNGHTGVVVPSEMAVPAVSVAVTDEGLGIDWVEAGAPAEAAGLEPGQRVIAIDGVAIEAAAMAAPEWRVAYAAPHKRKYESYDSLLAGLPYTTVVVTVETQDGTTLTVPLERQPTGDQWERNFREEHDPELWWAVGDDGIGLMWIGSLDGSNLGDRFEFAMSELAGTPGLVMDLRGNSGGSVELTFEMIGHFLQEPRVLGHGCSDHQEEDIESFCMEWSVVPAERPYRRPVAVLIDEDVVSAAEFLTYGLCVVGDARCFGRTTAGETDTVIFQEIPGAVVAMAASEFRPVVGESIQGVGVETDVRIGLTLDDLRHERDPVFDAAQRWLESDRNSWPNL